MPAAVPSRRPAWADLLIATGFVLWFYLPFLQPGLPYGDFPATVAIGEVERHLVPSPFAFPTWSPDLMCGRPTIGFMSPFRLLALPLASLEPILRMKALVVGYHLLAAIAMYALVRSSRAGGDAALFAALFYPILPEHVTRTVSAGHVQLPMFWALLPLVFLALFRARRDVRSVAVLALVLAATLLRDPQRAVLTIVMLAILLVPLALVRRRLRPLAGLFLAAALGAVAIDAVEVVNSWIGDPYRIGHERALQARQLDFYALDDLASRIDRGGSSGRYLGLSLLALVVAGALDPRGLGDLSRRFWLAAALLPLSLWLSCGARPLGGTTTAFSATALAFLAALVVHRNLSIARHRLPAALALAALLLALFLFTAPLPLLMRALFFLAELRNPGWFSIAVASFAVAYPAALALGALARRFGGRPWWQPALVALVVLTFLDLAPYRRALGAQRPPDYVAALADGYRNIAGDGEYARVLPAEGNSPLADLGYIWHGKRLAWDFRDYSAPRGTGELMERVFRGLGGSEGGVESAATLAGEANVKYVVDVLNAPPDLAPAAALELVARNPALAVYRNRRFRPFVHGESVAATWSRPAPEKIDVALAAATPTAVVIAESYHPFWTARLDGAPVALEPASGAFLGLRVPAGSHVLSLAFRRPASYWAMAGVSLASLLAALALALFGRRAPGPPLIDRG